MSNFVEFYSWLKFLSLIDFFFFFFGNWQMECYLSSLSGVGSVFSAELSSLASKDT